MGQAVFTLTIGDQSYPFEVLVIDNLTYPVVLGKDFGSVIDFQGHTLTLANHNSVPLYSSSLPTINNSTNPELVTVHAYATYILQPMSESVIPVYPKASLPAGKTGLIELNDKLAERYHVCGASQLVSLSEHETFPFRILNPTDKPVTIYRCSTMGTFISSDASMSVIATSDTPNHSPPSPSVEDEATVPLDLTSTTLDEHQVTQLKSLIAEYRDVFSVTSD